MIVDNNKSASELLKYGENFLTFMLIAAGITVIAIALLPDHIWIKAIALAYVVLP